MTKVFSPPHRCECISTCWTAHGGIFYLFVVSNALHTLLTFVLLIAGFLLLHKETTHKTKILDEKIFEIERKNITVENNRLVFAGFVY